MKRGSSAIDSGGPWKLTPFQYLRFDAGGYGRERLKQLAHLENAPNAAGIPLGRQGKVDEIAATCLFLVSDDGGFITGQTIHVNGGAGHH